MLIEKVCRGNFFGVDGIGNKNVENFFIHNFFFFSNKKLNFNFCEKKITKIKIFFCFTLKIERKFQCNFCRK